MVSTFSFSTKIKTVLLGCWLLFSSSGFVLFAENLAPDSKTSNYELKIITSGGFAAAYKLLAPQFEQMTGITLITSYGSSSGGAEDSIPVRLARGESFDLIILSKSSLEKLTLKGLLLASSNKDLATSSIGLAVIKGGVKPDISSNQAFIKTLVDAKSIGYSASASGTYLSTELWPKLGIWQDIKSKSKRILSERVATVVARGEVEIGFQQVSEIISIEGVDYVGTIPAAFQKYTVFSSGVLAQSKNPQNAYKFLEFISSKNVAKTIISTGLEPVNKL